MENGYTEKKRFGWYYKTFVTLGSVGGEGVDRYTT
jgi:hypothetical protein